MKNTICEIISEIWDTYAIPYAILATIAIIIGALAFAFGFICLQAWAIMTLWNWAIVGLLGAPMVDFWPAFSLSLLFWLFNGMKIVINHE